MVDELAPKWALAAQGTWQGQHELSVVRELDEIEGATVSSAARLLGWLSAYSKWNEVSKSHSELMAALEPLKSEAELDHLGRSYLAALVGFTTYLDSASHWATPKQFDELQLEVTRTGLRDIVNRLGPEPLPIKQPTILIARVQTKPGQVRKVAVASEFTRGVLGAGASDQTMVSSEFGRAYLRARLCQSALLRRFGNQARDALRLLTRLAAEVIEGNAVLLTGLERSTVGGKTELKLQPLWLENRSVLLAAVRAAEENAAVDAAELEALSDEPPNAGGHAEGGPVDSESGPDVPTDSKETKARRLARPEAALDPRGLFAQSMVMSDHLEGLWSAALAEVMTDEDVETESARWASLVVSQAASLIRQKDQPSIPGWPPISAHLEQLDSLEPADRLLLALVAAVEDLQKSVEGFRSPSTIKLEIRGTEARLKQWWSSGAFALVRAMASQMLRVSEQLGGVKAPRDDGHAPLGIDPTLARPPSEVALELARDAIEAGLPEASVVYQNMLFGVLEAEATERSELKDWLDSPDVRRTSGRLRALASRIGQGELPSLGETMILSRIGIGLLSAQVGLRAEIRLADPPEGDERAAQ